MVGIKRELLRRQAKEKHSKPGGLFEFVKYFWHVLEPKTPFVDGWAIRAICQHLEAVAYGDINRILVNVPPGFAKSLLCNVFFPAWVWGPLGRPHTRFIGFSYAAHLTERDNGKFRDLICCRDYQELYGGVFTVVADGVVKIANDKTGWKFASSVQGIGTGERADVLLCDDGHNVADGESDVIRTKTVRWFDESMSNRLNDLNKSAIVVIMQRVHEDDISGHILTKEPEYEHLCIAMEFDGRRCETSIGWADPRTEDGELAWPERYPETALARFRRNEFLWAGQYQQTPEPRGGGIIKRHYWQKLHVSLALSQREIQRRQRAGIKIPRKYESPQVSYVVASLDSAYTKQERNDPSGFTVWGVFDDQHGNSGVLLLHAWRKHLATHGPDVVRLPNEHEFDYVERAKKEWGIVEWMAYECKRLRVDHLLIEAKANGIVVAQEMQRLHGNNNWGVELVNPEGDKYARAMAVLHLWAHGFVHVPCSLLDIDNPDSELVPRDWAQLLIDESAVFPNGQYKDMTDSATQALKHLRSRGLAVRRDEVEAAKVMRAMYQPKPPPLYVT